MNFKGNLEENTLKSDLGVKILILGEGPFLPPSISLNCKGYRKSLGTIQIVLYLRINQT
jgi:hypothetical protein